MDDPIVWPILDEMLSCLEDAFASHEDPPAQICHRAGSGLTVAQFKVTAGRTAENECCGGLAWVRLQTFYPTGGDEQLEFNPRLSNCFDGLAVGLELGVLRCWPRAGAHASCDDWADVTRMVAADAAALRRAIACCWEPAHKEVGPAAVMGQWQAAGIEGQCVGGILPVTIGEVDRTPECCEPSSPSSP